MILQHIMKWLWLVIGYKSHSLWIIKDQLYDVTSRIKYFRTIWSYSFFTTLGRIRHFLGSTAWSSLHFSYYIISTEESSWIAYSCCFIYWNVYQLKRPLYFPGNRRSARIWAAGRSARSSWHSSKLVFRHWLDWPAGFSVLRRRQIRELAGVDWTCQPSTTSSSRSSVHSGSSQNPATSSYRSSSGSTGFAGSGTGFSTRSSGYHGFETDREEKLRRARCQCFKTCFLLRPWQVFLWSKRS